MLRREFLLASAFAPFAKASPNALTLSAGPLTLEFEPELAFVRYVRLGGDEVLRGIYAAVRDSTWGTVPPKVTNVQVKKRRGGFELTFDVDCTQGPISFAWRGAITGEAAGTLRFAMDGSAKTSFRRNRIGFCVLHPLKECVGQDYTAEKSDGSKTTGKFPELISPHQPVMDLRAITHRVAGAEAEVRFEGETFEMEDHRNWTDGNFKTYCTPLAKPWPVDVPQGTNIRQAVTLTIRGAKAAKPYRPAPRIMLFPTDQSVVKLPAIGVTHPSVAPQAAHLRVDWRPGEALPASELPLEIAALVAKPADLDELAAKAQGRNVVRYLILPPTESSTSREWLTRARAALKGAPVGGGTNVFFTELNRTRPDPAWLDVACYSINPQVHAFDNRSLVENLEPQGATLVSARAFLGSAKVAVTPVTLAQRFNQFSGKPNPPDPREGTPFAAAWFSGSVKYLAEAGADSVTYGMTKGAEALAPILAYQGGSSPCDVRPLRSTMPLRAVGLWLRKDGRERFLAINLEDRRQIVRLDEKKGGWRSATGQRFRGLNSLYLELELEPYAIAIFDR